MDINLLTKMLTELILRHDKVGLPGLGCFVAEEVGASFSNNGFTLNPPYRRLYFVEGRQDNKCLAEMYASTNGIDLASAEGVLSNYMKELKETIIHEKSVLLPGLGKLRATRDNGLFFVPDENLDIYPMGFGLESVSMKSHSSMDRKTSIKPAALSKPLQKAAPTPVAGTKEHKDAPDKASDTQSDPIPEQSLTSPYANQDEVSMEQPIPDANQDEVSMEQPTLQEQASEQNVSYVLNPGQDPMLPEEEDSIESSHSCPFGRIIRTALIVIVIAMLLLAAFLLLAKFAPDFIDSLLYTAEERAILNYQL